MLKIVCYGAGEFLKHFLNVFDSTKAQIIAVLDKNARHYEFETFVFDTQQPEVVKELEYDYIVITNENNAVDILATLLNLNVPAKKILFGGNFNTVVVRNNTLLRSFTNAYPMSEFLLQANNTGISRQRYTGNLADLIGEDPRHELTRIAALDLVAEQIKTNKLYGDVAELGVNKGRFARLINKVFPDRKIYLFDTFEGFDKRDTDNKVDNFNMDNSTIRLLYDDVKDTSVEYVLNRLPYPEQAVVKKGWFPDTTIGIHDYVTFSFVSIDTDLYDPTYSGLEFFYPRLTNGGYIFIHDYNCEVHPGVRKAVDLFCKENNLTVVPLPDRSGTAILAKRKVTYTREVLINALTSNDALNSD